MQAVLDDVTIQWTTTRVSATETSLQRDRNFVTQGASEYFDNLLEFLGTEPDSSQVAELKRTMARYCIAYVHVIDKYQILCTTMRYSTKTVENSDGAK